jgi:hypothetical protein
MQDFNRLSNCRPFDFKFNLWEIPSDRFLHFEANLVRKNEYLQFATNVTSDTEDDAEEWLQDWLQVKADNAGIRISNDFGRPCLHF